MYVWGAGPMGPLHQDHHWSISLPFKLYD
jgi:hypothetical protein